MVKRGKQREKKDEKSLAPTLELLWAFSCELTRGYCITSMTWNKQNPVTEEKKQKAKQLKNFL